MKRLSSKEDESALAMLKKEMIMMAPGAAKKYVTSRKLTKKEICVLLFVAFGKLLKGTSYKKGIGNLRKTTIKYEDSSLITPIYINWLLIILRRNFFGLPVFKNS